MQEIEHMSMAGVATPHVSRLVPAFAVGPNPVDMTSKTQLVGRAEMVLSVINDYHVYKIYRANKIKRMISIND
jgi:hypothetical protein